MDINISNITSVTVVVLSITIFITIIAGIIYMMFGKPIVDGISGLFGR